MTYLYFCNIGEEDSRNNQYWTGTRGRLLSPRLVYAKSYSRRSDAEKDIPTVARRIGTEQRFIHVEVKGET